MNTSSPSASLHADRIFGLLMVLFAITYGYFATQLPDAFGLDEGISPHTFPRILAVILGLSGFWLLLKPQPGETWPHGKLWLELVGNVLALTLFAFLLERLGFLLAAILCAGFISWRMGAKLSVAYALAVMYSLGLYLVFDKGLGLALPAGILGNLF